MGNERARQFMPFSALKGFDQMVQEQERQTEPRRELSEESADALSRILTKLQKGAGVRVTYYRFDHYETVTGQVKNLDPVYRILRVGDCRIAIDDIFQIEERE
ncbi:MAG: YolD-like family protein [Eubacteriaceae bacterium]|jgi:hypothetical protein|nr:YolD-like family protein [Eubacteriaceae bacterium]MDD4508433.1 YolD-like family protein [Eubacteriaceae bacterium]